MLINRHHYLFPPNNVFPSFVLFPVRQRRPLNADGTALSPHCRRTWPGQILWSAMQGLALSWRPLVSLLYTKTNAFFVPFGIVTKMKLVITTELGFFFADVLDYMSNATNDNAGPNRLTLANPPTKHISLLNPLPNHLPLPNPR